MEKYCWSSSNQLVIVKGTVPLITSLVSLRQRSLVSHATSQQGSATIREPAANKSKTRDSDQAILAIIQRDIMV